MCIGLVAVPVITSVALLMISARPLSAATNSTRNSSSVSIEVHQADSKMKEQAVRARQDCASVHIKKKDSCEPKSLPCIRARDLQPARQRHSCNRADEKACFFPLCTSLCVAGTFDKDHRTIVPLVSLRETRVELRVHQSRCVAAFYRASRSSIRLG